MKMRWFLLLSGFSTVLIFSAVSTLAQILVTFDDLYDNGFGRLITNAYQGLTWSNFGVVNSLRYGQPHLRVRPRAVHVSADRARCGDVVGGCETQTDVKRWLARQFVGL